MNKLICLIPLLFVFNICGISQQALADNQISSNSVGAGKTADPNSEKLKKVKIMENYYLKRGRTPEEALKEAWESVNSQEIRDKLRKEGKITVKPVKITASTNVPKSIADIQQSAQRSSRRIDMVVVQKSLHQMYLIKNNKILKKYFVALGKTPKGHKQYRGDNRTPEGDYILDYKSVSSNYLLSIHISYPNDMDRKSARMRGVDPGGMIMIHGQPNNIGYSEDEDREGEVNVDKFVQPSNWTNGCIALLNNDMAEVYGMIEPGTPITILP
jgi:murein L,D-transpeptidase YafK